MDEDTLQSKEQDSAQPVSDHVKGEADETKALRSELQGVQQKADEYLNGWKRAKADYENLKKDFEKERQTFIKFAATALLVEVSDIYGNLALALAHVPDEDRPKSWVTGFEHIRKQLWDLLSSQGIEEIKTVGEKFNPLEHEAVSAEQDTAVEQQTSEEQPNTEAAEQVIIKQVKPGFTLHGQVICPAKVVIK